MPRAERGEAHAQFLVGNAYFTGKGTERDFKQAAIWLRKAAEQGHPQAMVLLGLLCSGGKGVPLDTLEALKWYKLAEERGDAAGRQGAAAISAILPPEQVKAAQERARQSDAELLPAKRKRAQAGDARAQFELGLAYYKGLAIEPDAKKAFFWFSRAAAHGLPEAENNLGTMYELGQGTKRDFVRAMSLFRKAARVLPQAEVNIGGMYYKGEGVAKSVDRAVAWNRSAAGKGCAEAFHNLGSMYYHGIGVPKDPVEACKWFLLAASRGDSVGQRNTGQCSQILSDKDWSEAQARASKFQSGLSPQ